LISRCLCSASIRLRSPLLDDLGHRRGLYGVSDLCRCGSRGGDLRLSGVGRPRSKDSGSRHGLDLSSGRSLGLKRHLSAWGGRLPRLVLGGCGGLGDLQRRSGACVVESVDLDLPSGCRGYRLPSVLLGCR